MPCDVPSIFADDSWTVGEGTRDGQKIIVRARTGFPSDADRSLFKYLIVIGWAYESRDGMPDTDTNQRMVELEEQAEDGVETTGAGVMVAAVTGGNSKEWRFYCPNTEAFMDALNQALQGHEPYPIEIRTFFDEEWIALRELALAPPISE